MIFASVFGGFPLLCKPIFSKSPVHDVTKSYLSEKDPHKVSHRQINFDVTEYEKLINMAFKFYIVTNY